MSDSQPTTTTTTEVDGILDVVARLKNLMIEVDSESQKAVNGNKSATRKCRIALGNMKKNITPLRTMLQDNLKKSKT
jgi:hypothetical protein